MPADAWPPPVGQLATPPGATPVHVQDLLFPHGGVEPCEQATQPESFADLHLDQVLAAILAGREEYGLEAYFYAPLRDVDAVRYRQEVVNDLEQEAALAAVQVFAERMRESRVCLALATKLLYRLQQERWFIDGAAVYCEAVRSLAGELKRLDLRSRALRGMRDYLERYTSSKVFALLTSDTLEVRDALATVRYSLDIKGRRVRVEAFRGEADYGEAVQRTFARFEAVASDYRAEVQAGPRMNHVEEKILELVARLYPDVFTRLQDCCEAHADYLDPTVGVFDRQIQFYLAYLEFIAPFKAAGLSFCQPQVSGSSKEERVVQAFDLALADKLKRENAQVVGNDFALQGPERVLVVTGPNQGGKTTFARMIGQLHYLACLGLPVPAREARLFLPDRVFTHFEREEAIATLHSKLEDELVRLHAILQEATSDSLLVLNESLLSTTLNDALQLGVAVMRQIIDLGPLCVWVTFIDELASVSEATVSMVGTVEPGNPDVRTFRILPRPADGLAYAAAIAEKYHLSYESMRRRLA